MAATEKYDEDTGCVVRRCTICQDWWPADREFFYGGDGRGHLMNYCKACYMEKYKYKNKKGVAA